MASGTACDALLVSTNTSVDVWLESRHGVRCAHVTANLGSSDLDEARVVASASVDRILAKLDLAYAPAFARATGVEMPVFEPLYAYLLRYHLDGYLAFISGLRGICERAGIELVSVYERTYTEVLDCSTTTRDLLEVADLGVPFDVLRRSGVAGLHEAAVPTRSLQRVNPVRVAAKLASYLRTRGLIRRFSAEKPGRPTVLLSEPLYSMAVALPDIASSDGLYYPLGSWHPLGRTVVAGEQIEVTPLDAGFTALEQLVLAEVCQDATANSGNIVSAVRTLDAVHRKTPIHFGVWGGSPVTKPAAAIVAYLRAKGVETIGCQHGATYGEAIEPWHFESDLDRCDTFLTWGFDGADLADLYPDRRARAKVHPVGNPRHVTPVGRKSVDVMFPLTASLGVFNGGASRLEATRLLERQVSLLRMLDAATDLSVDIKPFPYVDEDYCAVLPLLESLSRARLVKGKTLVEYLSRSCPRLVIVEFPSQPLSDVMHLQAEIILMEDPLHPYGLKARALLERRVHFASDTDEVACLLEDFRKGTLVSKCDHGFYDHFIERSGGSSAFREFLRGRLVRAAAPVAHGNKESA